MARSMAGFLDASFCGVAVAVLVALMTTSSSVCQGQGMPAANGLGVSQCQYLIHSKSRWQTNAAPFKVYTRSRAREITSGSPVEVTIGPFSQHLNFFNFTDFILYATPATPGAPGMEQLEFWGGAGAAAKPHVGVFQLFPQWSAGAGGMSCNARSRTEDSVGAFEDRLLTIFKRLYPTNQMLARYQAPARNQISVLWWPTKEALKYPEIKFIANVKSMGNWFKIQSTPWKVNRPVDQWAMTERFLTQYQAMQGNLRAMERRMDQPAAV